MPWLLIDDDVIDGDAENVDGNGASSLTTDVGNNGDALNDIDDDIFDQIFNDDNAFNDVNDYNDYNDDNNVNDAFNDDADDFLVAASEFVS